MELKLGRVLSGCVPDETEVMQRAFMPLFPGEAKEGSFISHADSLKLAHTIMLAVSHGREDVLPVTRTDSKSGTLLAHFGELHFLLDCR